MEQKRRKVSRSISFRTVALLSLSVVALPLVLSVSIFGVYTITAQQQSSLEAHRSSLAIYSSHLENAVEGAQKLSTDVVANDIDFQSILYAKSHTDAYVHSYLLSLRAKAIFSSNPLVTGSFSYSEPFNCYRAGYADNYPVEDVAKLRDLVTREGGHSQRVARWNPVTLSHGTVFVYTNACRNTVFAMMVDPSKQEYPDLGPGERIFYLSESGTELTPKSGFGGGQAFLPGPLQAGQRVETGTGSYNMTALPVNSVGSYIVYASPCRGILDELDVTQKVLLVITFCFMAFIPLCWLLLRKFFLAPLTGMVSVSQEIQEGNTEVRVDESSGVEEARDLARTVNSLLSITRQQKIDLYELRLMTQQAQLQYLQLQIRPHFFLNCLNSIYSLAEKRNFRAIQAFTLDLSDYLRCRFKDSFQLIPLEDELTSLRGYIGIVRTGASYPPELQLQADPAVVSLPVPPLSVLTFAENAVKHCGLQEESLRLRVRCQRLRSGDGDWLNITVTDNGLGVSKPQLTALNSETPDAKPHVGVANIRARLRLLYGGRATLTFRGLSRGLLVELFLPIEKGSEAT